MKYVIFHFLIGYETLGEGLYYFECYRCSTYFFEADILGYLWIYHRKSIRNFL